jgi:hypothetical protein
MVLIEKIIFRYLDKNKKGKFKSFTTILLSTQIISVQILNILVVLPEKCKLLRGAPDR